MKSSQKVALSLLIAVVVFSAFAVISFSGLFNYIDATFYNTRVRESVYRRLGSAVDAVSSYQEKNQRRFQQILDQPSVKNIYQVNQSREDIQNQEAIFGSLKSDMSGFMFVRFIDNQGQRLHYSSLPSDVLQSGANQMAYKPPGEIAEPVQLASLALPQSTAFDLMLVPKADMYIYRFLVKDQFNIVQGTALFYVSARGLTNELISDNIIDVGTTVRIVTDNAVLLNLPEKFGDSLAQAVLSTWSVAQANSTPLLKSEGSGSYFVFSRATKPGGFGLMLAPEADFHMQPIMQWVLLAGTFLTTFLLVFLLLNIRQDAVLVLSDRIKRFQIHLLQEYLEDKEQIDWKRWQSQLESRRDEVTQQIKKGLGPLHGKKGEEIDHLINQSWDEILTVLGTKQVEARTSSLDVARLEDIIQRAVTNFSRLGIGAEPSTSAGNVPGRGLPVGAGARTGEAERSSQKGSGTDGRERGAGDNRSYREDRSDEGREEPEEPEELEEVEAAEELAELEDVEEGPEGEAASDEEVLDEIDAVDDIDAVEDLEEVAQAGETEELAAVDEAEHEVEEAESIDSIDNDEIGELEEAAEVEEVESLEDAEEAKATGQLEALAEIGELDEIEVPGESEDLEELAEVEELNFPDFAAIPSEEDLRVADDVLEEQVERADVAQNRSVLPEGDTSEAAELEEIPEEFEQIEELEPVYDAETDSVEADTISSASASRDQPAPQRIAHEQPWITVEGELLDELEPEEEEFGFPSEALPISGSGLYMASKLSFGGRYEAIVGAELPELVSVETDDAEEVELLPEIAASTTREPSGTSSVSRHYAEPITATGESTESKEEAATLEGLSAEDFQVIPMSRILSLISGTQDIISEREGVPEIRQTVFGAVAQRDEEPQRREFRGLAESIMRPNDEISEAQRSGIDELLSIHAIDLFPAEYRGKTNVPDGSSRTLSEGGVHRLRFRSDGLDYDWFMQRYRQTESGIIKSLVEMTRFFRARAGSLFLESEKGLRATYSLGLDEACMNRIIAKRDTRLFQDVFQKRRALYLRVPLNEVANFRSVCEESQFSHLQKSLFLPIKFQNKPAYLLVSVHGEVDTFETLFVQSIATLGAEIVSD